MTAFKPTGGPDAGNVHKELGGKRGGPIFHDGATPGFPVLAFDKTFTFASAVTADANGVARILFAPSRIGGDRYRLRAFVGPVTQDKTVAQLNAGVDDVVETGTMVRWRSVRVCHDIVMPPADDRTQLPASNCLRSDGTPMPNVELAYGALPALDLPGFITTEFARSYCELIVEPAAEAPVSVAVHGADILATAQALALSYPKFNSTAYSGGSIHRQRMVVNPLSGDRRFEVVLPTLPAPGTVSVRAAGGGEDSALADNKDGPFSVTDLGSRTVNAGGVDRANVMIEFAQSQAGKAFDVCYHPAKYVDIANLLEFPATSPYLFNLKLPRLYNATVGAGYLPADLNPADETARPDRFHAFIDARALGLVKALLFESLVRGVGLNGGYSPGLMFFRAHAVDNYTAIWPTGIQEGKGVGAGILLFDIAGAPDLARFNALTLHEMSHGLLLSHAPNAPSGVKAGQHDPADKCVMSYDPNDGDHCGHCVAALRGMRTRLIEN